MKLVKLLLLSLMLVACGNKQPEYLGSWTAKVDGQEVITTINADGTVVHQRGEHTLQSRWTLQDNGTLLMADGYVIAEVLEGKLYVTENRKTAVLVRKKD